MYLPPLVIGGIKFKKLLTFSILYYHIYDEFNVRQFCLTSKVSYVMFDGLNFKEVKVKPNPGGTITGEAIVNREKEIESIWRTLQNRSVVVTSERRVGKTSILRKMEEKSRAVKVY